MMPRVFLDTNIVWYVDWLGPLIFDGDDQVLQDEKFLQAKRSTKEQWLALAQVFRWAQQVSPIFIVTESLIQELRSDRRPYGREMYEWSMANDPLHDELETTDADLALLRALPDHELTSFLPDAGDRRLIAEASYHLCGIFLTMDKRTIWKHHQRVHASLGISVLLPSQLANMLGLQPDPIGAGVLGGATP